jgi:GTP pyrophosphokinase
MSKQLVFLKGYAKGKEYYEMLQAINVATVLHEGQERRTGGKYIEHPIYVAHTLVSLGLDDEDLLSAAILHDVIEDCSVSKSDLMMSHGFSSDVVDIVSLLSKNPNTSTDFYYSHIKNNINATLIKIADRCHNISTMIGAFTVEKMKSYVEETETYVLPLCKHAIRAYPEISDDIYIMRNHIESVVACIKVFIEASDKNEN